MSYAFFRRLAGLFLVLGALLPSTSYAQSSTGQRDVLRDITSVVGLKPRFELQATSEVDNAAAVVYNGQRYLLYNPQFVAAVNRAGRTDWAGTSILAHEMGHHLNGHTLTSRGSNPADELEADEFSGFVLRKMGASLAQAQAAMAVISDEHGSATHPGRSQRLAAISRGWQQSNTQIAASTRTTAPSSAPAVLRPQTTAPAVARNVANRTAIVGKLTFRDAPDEPFYLTDRLNVVHVEPGTRTAEVVGRITRSDDEDFPLILVDSKQRRLYIDTSGAVYNPNGRLVAMLTDAS
ncbi:MULTISPECIES: membrane-binding protein [Hymenobacter]|uniref:Membrane-binding protein n=1 Tax=Hymenobacter profundi TaxID=1982110 RepID=A0ABS6WV00_9BACT|nr:MULTISPECIES: membrane-binding protein [Hymenobacter]MBW3127413.1 membrane-binding protein [Hymenobacter profundi]QNE39731.1 membrane-binding protein [Hymenobacter sp. NBH84]